MKNKYEALIKKSDKKEHLTLGFFASNKVVIMTIFFSLLICCIKRCSQHQQIKCLNFTMTNSQNISFISSMHLWPKLDNIIITRSLCDKRHPMLATQSRKLSILSFLLQSRTIYLLYVVTARNFYLKEGKSHRNFGFFFFLRRYIWRTRFYKD